MNILAKNKAKKIGIKNLKRTLYKSRGLKLKRTVSIMVITGLVASALWLCRYVYLGYAEATANIVLSYPEIAYSSMPDNSRFTYYDLISTENLNAALKIMQADGLYENYTAEDLADCFYLYSNLESNAASTVDATRSGDDVYGFVANSYRLTFVQPHDSKNGNLFKRFFTPDNSDTFLKALIEAYRIKLAETCGGINSFKEIARLDNADSYDYSEKVKVYKSKIYEVRNYISAVSKKKSDFVSTKQNLTLKELSSRYDFLMSSDLDSISNFIESSALSKDVDLAINKLKVNIENNSLKYNKYYDKVAIGNYAMANYDQVFTENLIVPVRDDDYGLYQARPKTAFDKVAKMKHEDEEEAANYAGRLSVFWDDLGKYYAEQEQNEEHDRLAAKCDELIAAFESKYAALTSTASDVIKEYFNDANDKYITAKIEKRNIFNKSMVVKFFIVFAVAAAAAFIASTLIREMIDASEMRKKKKLLKEIKHTAKE